MYKLVIFVASHGAAEFNVIGNTGFCQFNVLVKM